MERIEKPETGKKRTQNEPVLLPGLRFLRVVQKLWASFWSFKLLERGTIRDAKATDQLISRCPSLDHHNARAEEFYGALC